MIAITGATGIIGSHIAVKLLQAGESVRLLKRANSSTIALDQLLSFNKLTQKNIEWVNGDITDPLSIRSLLEGCKHLYHTAALVSFDQGDADKLYSNNIHGTGHVVDQCLSLGVSLTYISSTAAIGDQKIDGVYTEVSSWTTDRGRSAYAISKRYAELEVFRGVEEGLKAVIINPGVVIGPGNWGQSSTSIFLNGMKGLLVYPSGSNGFVDVRDVAEMAIALTYSKEPIKDRHLLIGENLSFKDLFAKMAKLKGRKAPNIEVPNFLIKPVVQLLAFLEKWSISPVAITSENLKSAYRKSVYSVEKMRQMGFQFRSIDEALRYTNEVYNATMKH
jgi:nucleoside-diphosphate-sugar epimerase